MATTKRLTAQEQEGSFKEWWKELRGRSDRVCAIVGVAFIELRITRLLESFFVDDARGTARLLGPSGLVGSFGAKTNLAFALGLISDVQRHDLDVVRQIRNKFAHHHLSVSFSKGETLGLARRLKIAKKLDPETKLPPRTWFTLTITLLSGHLLPPPDRGFRRRIPADPYASDATS